MSIELSIKRRDIRFGGSVMERHLVGDTIKITWISSGATPSQITAAIITGSETVIDSGSMTSSGNGHYYYDFTIPDSGQAFYVAETISWVNSLPYKRRTRFKAVLMEVD